MTARASVAALLGLDGLTSPSSAGSAAILPAAGLHADAATLRRPYTALHPGLYRYNTLARVEGAFGVLEHEFQQQRAQERSTPVCSR
jgi:hypothetical protein